jgi:hypothetical protein
MRRPGAWPGLFRWFKFIRRVKVFCAKNYGPEIGANEELVCIMDKIAIISILATFAGADDD